MAERATAFRGGFWTTVGVVAALFLLSFILTKRT